MTSRPPRGQDPAELEKSLTVVGEVAETEGDGDGLKASLGERKGKGIGFQKLHRKALRPGFPAGNLQHGQGEVRPHHLSRGRPPLQHKGQVSRARGQVQDAPGIFF